MHLASELVVTREEERRSKAKLIARAPGRKALRQGLGGNYADSLQMTHHHRHGGKRRDAGTDYEWRITGHEAEDTDLAEN